MARVKERMTWRGKGKIHKLLLNSVRQFVCIKRGSGWKREKERSTIRKLSFHSTRIGFEQIIIRKQRGYYLASRRPTIYVCASLMNFGRMQREYRVIQQVSDPGWVDFDFGFSTVYPLLSSLMRDKQNGQRTWARWQEHPNQSQPTQVRDLLNHPVLLTNVVGRHKFVPNFPRQEIDWRSRN